MSLSLEVNCPDNWREEGRCGPEGIARQSDNPPPLWVIAPNGHRVLLGTEQYGPPYVPPQNILPGALGSAAVPLPEWLADILAGLKGLPIWALIAMGAVVVVAIAR